MSDTSTADEARRGTAFGAGAYLLLKTTGERKKKKGGDVLVLLKTTGQPPISPLITWFSKISPFSI